MSLIDDDDESTLNATGLGYRSRFMSDGEKLEHKNIGRAPASPTTLFSIHVYVHILIPRAHDRTARQTTARFQCKVAIEFQPSWLTGLWRCSHVIARSNTLDRNLHVAAASTPAISPSVVPSYHLRYHILVTLVLLILLCSWKMPYRSASAVGGHPGT